MKFVICVVVICSLTMNALGNPVPLALNTPLFYSAAYGPGISIDNSDSVAIPAATHLFRAPLFVPVGLNTEGTYIAKTPGSEHIAALPGHLNSASSINLEQAPGTNKDGNQDPITLLPSVAVHSSGIPAVLPLSISPLILQAPLVPAQATYVAKNLGVEHIAPLPGHLISASSFNLEQAPGINKDSITNLSSVAVHSSVNPAVISFTLPPLIVQGPLNVNTEATYVAKNLGVEHIASLPGHTVSATSLNLEPAPGSK